MPYVIGVILALSTVAFARLVGFDRDRAFYPIVLVIIASYYVLCRDQLHNAANSSVLAWRQE